MTRQSSHREVKSLGTGLSSYLLRRVNIQTVLQFSRIPVQPLITARWAVLWFPSVHSSPAALPLFLSEALRAVPADNGSD